MYFLFSYRYTKPETLATIVISFKNKTLIENNYTSCPCPQDKIKT